MKYILVRNQTIFCTCFSNEIPSETILINIQERKLLQSDTWEQRLWLTIFRISDSDFHLTKELSIEFCCVIFSFFFFLFLILTFKFYVVWIFVIRWLHDEYIEFWYRILISFWKYLKHSSGYFYLKVVSCCIFRPLSNWLTKFLLNQHKHEN